MVNPQVFVRCGYPLGISDGIQAITVSYGDEVNSMLRSISPAKSFSRCSDDRFRHSYEKIMRELAVVWLKEQKFGSNERSIHTEEDTKVTEGNPLYEIKAIRYVKTGTRDPGGAYDYLSPEDWEPPSLYNQKTHRILGLVDSGEIWSTVLFEIEDIHVEKIKE